MPPRSQSVCEVEQILREKTEALKIEEDINDNDNFQANGNTPLDSTEEELERVTVTAHVNSVGDQATGETPIHQSNHNAANGTGPRMENSAGSNTQYANGGSEPRRHQVPTPLLPPLTEPVPSDWVTIEDDFVLFCASYQSHLGNDYVAHPDSRYDDGIMYLGFVRNSPTGIRKKLLSMMTKTEDGSHINVPGYEVVKVKAFRLEPLTATGTISVDGEMVDYGPIQAQVLPGMARVMVSPR